MLQDPNVERYVEQAMRPVLNQIKELKAEVELLKKALLQTNVSGLNYRYPMTYDQLCQIDCRVTSCKFYKGSGFFHPFFV